MKRLNHKITESKYWASEYHSLCGKTLCTKYQDFSGRCSMHRARRERLRWCLYLIPNIFIWLFTRFEKPKPEFNFNDGEPRYEIWK